MTTRVRFPASLGALAVLSLIALPLLGGCSESQLDQPGTRTPRPEERAVEDAPERFADDHNFEQQLRLGRRGSRDRIELLATTVDDESVLRLGVGDDWVETLIIDDGAITDAATDAIASLPNLLHLRLRHSPIGDAGFATLAGCPSLRFLNLPHCAASAAGIESLQTLASLRSLRIGGSTLSDASSATKVADAIATLENLRSLHLIGVPIDDEGLRRIVSLPKLRSLYLDDSAVTQAGWDWLFESRPEIHVHVNQRHPDRPDHSHSHTHDAADAASIEQDPS